MWPFSKKKTVSKSKGKQPDLITVEKSGNSFNFNFSEEQQCICINDNKVLATLEQSADGFNYISWGNKKYTYQVVSRNDKKYTVLVNGVEYNFTIETPLSFERKKLIEKQKGKDKNFKFTAPMPGKIIDVFVETGTYINEGDSLFILEAMKMQNEILSDFSGKLIEVNMKKGDSVAKDQILFVIEKG